MRLYVVFLTLLLTIKAYRELKVSINNMKKVILFCVMILVSSFIYADEVRDVNGEARGFSNTNVII